jgi:hypothetical protein
VQLLANGSSAVVYSVSVGWTNVVRLVREHDALVCTVAGAPACGKTLSEASCAQLLEPLATLLLGSGHYATLDGMSALDACAEMLDSMLSGPAGKGNAEVMLLDTGFQALLAIVPLLPNPGTLDALVLAIARSRWAIAKAGKRSPKRLPDALVRAACVAGGQLACDLRLDPAPALWGGTGAYASCPL